MPLELTFGAEAERDLQEQLTWITERAGPELAREYMTRVRRGCEKLLLMPNGGTPRPRFGRGFRSVAFERKLIILYRLEGETLVVKRVLHGRRDLARLLPSARRRT
jgi:toxin ParE1/3/4